MHRAHHSPNHHATAFWAALLEATRAVARWGLWVGGSLMVIVAIMIGLDITLRVSFNESIDGTVEITQFALAISSTWALAGALLDRAHIRVDTAYARFPGAIRVVLDLLGLIAFFIVFALIFYFGLNLVMESWLNASRSESALQIPMVIPQVLWLIGIAFFLMSDLVLFVIAVRLILLGHTNTARDLIGMKTAEEEVQDELDLGLEVHVKKG
ncbi:MAG: TRAP transporter small permease [Polaromonas sp.]|nr:TRAP transporter small permease [Polaromonas sp.]